MDKKQFKQAAIIGGLLFFAWWLLKKNSENTVMVQVAPEAAPPAQSGWVPGENDPNIIWGGNNSTINVNVPGDFLLGALSRQYIPMFGFTGVAAVGAM